MTIQQTVAVPDSRNVHFDVTLPDTLPRGPVNIFVRFEPVNATPTLENAPTPVFEPFPTIEELKAEAGLKTAEQQAYFEATGKDPLVELRDSMQETPFAGIDGVEYQREMRGEWPD